MGASTGLFFSAQKQHWQTLQGLPMSFASHFRYTWTQAAEFPEYQHTYIFNTTRCVPYSLEETQHIAKYPHYIQCIILATRPLLFCFLKIRFESPESCLESLNASRNVRNLMQMCLESAQNIISILSSLQSQGLLGKNSPLLQTVHLHSHPSRNLPPL